MKSIAIARPSPDTAALAHVRKILSPDFPPSDFEAALDGMATRAAYPPTVAALSRFVRAKRGDSPLVATLVDPLLTQDVRARRVSQAVGLFKRDDADAFGFAFGYAELVEATRVAPLARLALCCLGYVLDPDGTPIPYQYGMAWPDTRRERAGLALHFLTRRAFDLRGAQ
ncbi:hypothetical protein ASD45_19170 [Pseudolabrys sp. Root1462]|uniref:hypothetical protein n=1 Tax=Pseudolabrys sp. Root1462 TaxID=1736466 RepID=UPI000703066E|nr:hypothetical protein [Pseudolabrys sp. Root1462]KQY98102.1 hypothetical protein ASD45_19170 [Pseudolabrys sp. Root1462]